MINKESIGAIVESCLDADTEFLVDVSVSSSNSIVVLIDSDLGVSIDRCVEVSRQIEKSLDREKEDFSLEVSSAGLSSPLKLVRQYKKNIGRQLDIVAVDGAKMTGKLTEVGEESFTILISEKVKKEGSKKKELVERTVELPYAQVKSAKIVVSYR